MCGNCAVWAKDEEFLFETVALAKSVRAVNVCGGDPLYERNLSTYLQELKNKKIFTILTTNGQNLGHFNKEIIKLIDLPVVYLPGWGKIGYLAEAGLDGYKQLLNALDYLEELGKKYLINFPVNPLAVEILPEVIELIESRRKAYLVITYQPAVHGVLSAESLKYLKYCARKHKVLVYETAALAGNFCLGCFLELEQITFKNILFFAQLSYKLYF